MIEDVRAASAGASSKHWMTMRPPGARSPCQVLLVPHGGAGPSVFWPMVRRLPADWAVAGLCLPGRDRRALEEPEWSLEQTAAEAAREALALLERGGLGSAPLIMVGQCMGAWLGHLILVHGGAEFQRRCHRFVVLSQKPLHAPRLLSHANDDSEQLWHWLESSGTVPAQVARDSEIRQMLEPIMRADLASISRFPATAPAVDCPIDVVVGEQDPDLGRLAPEEWSRYTTRLRVLRLPYGHILAHDSPDRCAEIVVRAVSGEKPAIP